MHLPVLVLVNRLATLPFGYDTSLHHQEIRKSWSDPIRTADKWFNTLAWHIALFEEWLSLSSRRWTVSQYINHIKVSQVGIRYLKIYAEFWPLDRLKIQIPWDIMKNSRRARWTWWFLQISTHELKFSLREQELDSIYGRNWFWNKIYIFRPLKLPNQGRPLRVPRNRPPLPRNFNMSFFK